MSLFINLYFNILGFIEASRSHSDNTKYNYNPTANNNEIYNFYKHNWASLRSPLRLWNLNSFQTVPAGFTLKWPQKLRH